MAGEIVVIAIGRNEGSRLSACLASIPRDVPVVYVDSGSTDDSLDRAATAGATIVRLDAAIPFTAARARNSGVEALRQMGSLPTFIQFIDGDCVLAPAWVAIARSFLNSHPEIAAVCGRRRERFPKASLYNRLCDLEWDTPTGETTAFGGDVFLRSSAFEDAGGYRDDLISGEEPELCIRLRERGHKIWRLDAAMTLHDADMHHFSQWWRRSVRGGYGTARVAWLYRGSRLGIWRREVARALFYGLGVPMVSLLGSLVVHPSMALLLLLYPLQLLRTAMRRGVRSSISWTYATLMVLGKFAETQGILRFASDLVRGRSSDIIEYKELPKAKAGEPVR